MLAFMRIYLSCEINCHRLSSRKYYQIIFDFCLGVVAASIKSSGQTVLFLQTISPQPPIWGPCCLSSLVYLEFPTDAISQSERHPSGERCRSDAWPTTVVSGVASIWWQMSLQCEAGTKEERGHKSSSLIQRCGRNSFPDIVSFYWLAKQRKHRVLPFRFTERNRLYCHTVNLPPTTLWEASALCLTHVSLTVPAETRRAPNLPTENSNTGFWLSSTLTFKSSVCDRKPEIR